MTTRRAIVSVLILAPFIVLIAAYAGSVHDGSVSPPDWTAISEAIGLGTATFAKTIAVLALAGMGILAVLAPVLYAARAGDVLIVIISLAMTAGAIALLSISRTSIDLIAALVIYLANIILSAVVYAAHRIAPATA